MGYNSSRVYERRWWLSRSSLGWRVTTLQNNLSKLGVEQFSLARTRRMWTTDIHVIDNTVSLCREVGKRSSFLQDLHVDTSATDLLLNKFSLKGNHMKQHVRSWCG